jgi:TPR repeat protein
LNLAMLYGQGQGVARDKQKSLLWLTRSAKQGNATAQYQLGVQQHLACRKDSSAAVTEVRIEALKWVQLSATQGCRHADIACEFIALGMTREVVAESGRRAAAFIVG